MEPILSILIVTFNHEKEIDLCLNAIADNLHVTSFEVITIDNHSGDNTISVINKWQTQMNTESSRLKLIKNTQNSGFTKAVNQSISAARGRFLLLLNPDTQITSRSIDELLLFLSNHPAAGAVAPQLVYPDGTIQPSCRRFPKYRYILFEVLGLNIVFKRSAFFNGWKMGDFDHESVREVQQPQGSCLLIRKAILDQIGNLDERFFIFFSDVDLCRRLWRHNLKVFFYPSVKVIHTKGSSIYTNRSKMIWQSHKDFILYFLKWYNTPSGWICNCFGLPFLIFVGVIRWCVAKIGELFKRKKDLE